MLNKQNNTESTTKTVDLYTAINGTVQSRSEEKLHDILRHGLCGRCNINPGQESHTCPYAEEIEGDYISECNCCDDCCNGCGDDI